MELAVVLCSLRADSGDETMTVGAMERVARLRSTPGPATELMMIVECENSAAKVSARTYESVKASAGKNVSEGLKR